MKCAAFGVALFLLSSPVFAQSVPVRQVHVAHEWQHVGVGDGSRIVTDPNGNPVLGLDANGNVNPVTESILQFTLNLLEGKGWEIYSVVPASPNSTIWRYDILARRAILTPEEAGIIPTTTTTLTAAPPSTSTCASPKPGESWVCVNGGWIPGL